MKKFNKISMMVVATVMFLGIMSLSLQKNGEGKWEFAPIKAMAQGGSETTGSTRSGTHNNLTNSRGFSGVGGMYTIFNPPGTNPGSALVVINGSLGNIIWVKTADYSTVGVIGGGTRYNISYKADYSYGSISTGNLVVNDEKVVTW